MQYFRVLFAIFLVTISQLLFAQKNNSATSKNDFADSKKSTEQKKYVDSIKNLTKPYPVKGFFNDTLFNIYTKTGSFSAEMRARIISERINELADHYTPQTDSIHLDDLENTTDIVFKEIILMSVTNQDALVNNTNRYELADTYKAIITNTIIEYNEEVNLKTIAKEASVAILVLIIISILFFYIVKFFKWTASRIILSENKLLKGIKIKNYTLIDSKNEINALLYLNTAIKWFALFITAYIALPILFGFFPWTKNFVPILLGYILDPIKSIAINFWNYLPNLITILVIVIVFHYINKVLRFLKKEIELGILHLPGFYPDWANPTYQIIRVLLFAFLVVVIFPYLPGSNSPVFQGVSVFLGFLLTFGSAGSLSNIISGIILTYMRLFKLGDRIKINDITGDVIEKSLLVTRIRTIQNEIVSIPNSTIMNSHTINYSSDALINGLILHTTVTIGYDVPWKDIDQALVDAALATTYILHDPKPFVLQTGLEDFYVSYQLNAYTKEANKQPNIYSELHQKIQDVCNERGIEIMSPHYRAGRDGNATTIPSNYLAKDYKPPSFNVNIHNTNSEENK